MENNYNPIILHIPHALSHIPDYTGYIAGSEGLEKEIALLTDHATDRIFDIGELTRLVVDFNRIFCDVERLPDDQEGMYRYGRGFYYTRCDNKLPLREEDPVHKQRVYENYYLPHHRQLTEMVMQKLDSFKGALIIDCHSFCNEPFKTDLIQLHDRPDFCIGTDDFHTPMELALKVVNSLKKKGFSVKINDPYSGTLIPMELYRKNKAVTGIMIEVNRRLYMNEGRVLDHKVEWLRTVINEVINTIGNHYY